MLRKKGGEYMPDPKRLAIPLLHAHAFVTEEEGEEEKLRNSALRNKEKPICLTQPSQNALGMPYSAHSKHELPGPEDEFPLFEI